MIIDKDKFPTEVDHIVHSVHDGENLLHLVHIPLVRCKDCKYMKVHGWNPKKEVSTCHYHCEFWNHAVDDCDFCSRGERKDEID